MLKECLYIPTPESGRLILRKLTVADTDDLKEWLGREEIYIPIGAKVQHRARRSLYFTQESLIFPIPAENDLFRQSGISLNENSVQPEKQLLQVFIVRGG